MAPTVWTPARKWMGNLIPLLFWLILASIGVYKTVINAQFIGPGLWYLCGATAIGWLATDLFGLYGNATMRAQLGKLLNREKLLPKESVFVGFCSPKYSGMLDAHEDIGFLCFYKDKLTFVGESRIVEVDKPSVKSISFRPNVHTILGLGRWIAIEGSQKGAPFRMMVEPRERQTMLGNLMLSGKLKRELQNWKKA